MPAIGIFVGLANAGQGSVVPSNALTSKSGVPLTSKSGVILTSKAA